MTMTMLAIIASTVDGIKTELALFLLAFFLHLVVFRGRKVGSRTQKIAKEVDGPSTYVSCKTAGSCAKSNASPSAKLVFSSTVESICKGGADKQTLTTQLRKELQQVPCEERVDALTSLMHCASRSKVTSEDLLSAVHLLLEEHGLKPSMPLYESFLLGYVGLGNLSKMQQIMEAMRSAGLQPRITTFNLLLDAAVKKGHKQAWTVIDEMKLSGVKPDAVTCAILLKTIQTSSSSPNVERVMAMVSEMDSNVDEVLLSSVVEACLRGGRADLLKPHLKQRTIMQMQVKSPHTYGSIIRAYGFLKDTKGVWDTWREMRSRHVVPTSITMGCMVEALITNGDVEAGYDFIREIAKDNGCRNQINAVIYGSVLKGFAQQRKFERVWSLYQEMLELKLQFSIVTFNTLVDACARSREMHRVKELLESMVAQGIKPNIITYSAILKGYCQGNQLDEAFKFLEDMVQTTEFRPDEVIYNTLLDGCARQGLYDKGMDLLAEMQRVGVRPSNFTLAVLVKLAGRSKKVDKAFEICDEISSKYKFRLNSHVYSNLVWYSASKDLQRAMETLEKMISERVRPDARIYESLLRACVQERRAQDAAGLLRAAMGLQGVHPRLSQKPANLLQPQARLSVELIEEVLDGIVGLCKDSRLAAELLQELRRVPGLRFDPKLQVRLAANSF